MTKEKSKCCEYHNKMEFDDTDLTECGMAGMGESPMVCCPNCPEVEFYNSRLIKVEFYKPRRRFCD